MDFQITSSQTQERRSNRDLRRPFSTHVVVGQKCALLIKLPWNKTYQMQSEIVNTTNHKQTYTNTSTADSRNCSDYSDPSYIPDDISWYSARQGSLALFLLYTIPMKTLIWVLWTWALSCIPMTPTGYFRSLICQGVLALSTGCTWMSAALMSFNGSDRGLGRKDASGCFF